MDFNIRAAHIRGVDNVAADALSGDNIQLFRSCCPQVDPQGTAVSPEVVLDAVLLQDPDWMAKDWTELWAFYLGQALADRRWRSNAYQLYIRTPSNWQQCHVSWSEELDINRSKVTRDKVTGHEKPIGVL